MKDANEIAKQFHKKLKEEKTKIQKNKNQKNKIQKNEMGARDCCAMLANTKRLRTTMPAYAVRQAEDRQPVGRRG